MNGGNREHALQGSIDITLFHIDHVDRVITTVRFIYNPLQSL